MRAGLPRHIQEAIVRSFREFSRRALGVAIVLASANPATAVQSAQSSDTAVVRGERVPDGFRPARPSLTPEEFSARRDAMRRVNPVLPRLRVETGATVVPPSVPETVPSRPSNKAAFGPAAAGTFAVFRTTAQGPLGVGTSPIGESQAAAAGSVAFMTANWWAAYSTDRGASFTYVNPATQFPSVDAGFCCDQTVTYDRWRSQFIWQVQYDYSAITQRGSYRTAFASLNSVAAGGWCYYTWSPASFGFPAGTWLDYPHVAVSNNYVWYTANVFNSASQFQASLIWRIPLATANACGSLSADYLVVADRGSLTLTQGATTTMYFATHNSTSSIRIYRWAETSNTVFQDDVVVSTWPNVLPAQCPGADGLNWCGRPGNDGRILSGWVAGGVIGYMWNATGGGGFPNPHIRAARFVESTRALIDQPHIWHSTVTWQFPALSVNDRGHLAGTVHWSEPTSYPSMAAVIADDISAVPPPWENYGIATGSMGANSWGDYYSSRPHGTYPNTWTATGQARLDNGSVQVRYVWFGRERDAPSGSMPVVTSPTVASLTATSAMLGGTVADDGQAGITERGVVSSKTSVNANPTISGTGVTKTATSGTTGAFTVNVGSLTPSTSYSFKAYATNSSGTSYTSPASTFVTSLFAGPATLTATASASLQVGLSWPAVPNASYYEVSRNAGSGYSPVGTPPGPSYTDTAVSAATTYLYRVRAVDSAGNISTFSPVDPATTLLFSNDPLPVSSIVRQYHVTELRTAVNAMRATAGLSATTFSDSLIAGVTPIRALHINQLRTSLAEARSVLGLAALIFSESALTAFSTTVKASHIQELREGVR